MKRILFSLSLIICQLATSNIVAQNIPAFPGAEGHGRYVQGGRGGVVRHVTSLVDDGKTTTKGTLRWAVNGSTKKIIVFDVAGVIALKKDLNIGANTTILGQTAPSPGITVRYYTVQPGANNIIRFIRFRRGQEKDVNDGADAAWQRETTGIILDHCSFSWSIDEVASFYDNNNFTMQWCTLGESLNNAGHGKGAHGYGGIWGGKLASFHHNFIAHVNNRAPRFCGARYKWTGYTKNYDYDKYNWENYVQAENVDYRNCVVYNCGNASYGGPGGGYINFVNNTYKRGPAANTSQFTKVTVGASGNSTPADLYGMTSRYYINGNDLLKQDGSKNNSASNDNWTAVGYDGGTYTIDGEICSIDKNHLYGESVTYKKNDDGDDCVTIKVTEPMVPLGDITTHTADKAYEKVLAYAGVTFPFRDDVDERYMEETKNGTATYKGSVTNKAGRIDLVSDVNGYTEENFATAEHPAGFDTDQDGMPDAWETANGLDPNDDSDGALKTIDTEKGWYTNLEVYASSLVESIMKGGNADGESNYTEYYPKSKSTGINNTLVSAIISTEYYDLQGRRLIEPKNGISIRIEHMSDGRKVATKVMK